MHVFEFFDFLLVTPHIEVVKSAPPELPQRESPVAERQLELRLWTRLFFARRRRETLCFSTCITVEGVPFAGSLMSR